MTRFRNLDESGRANAESIAEGNGCPVLNCIKCPIYTDTGCPNSERKNRAMEYLYQLNKKKKKDKIAVPVIILAISFLVAFIIVHILDAYKEDYQVTTQHGFNIDVDNDLMQIACSYHGLKYDDIRWDTVNKSFVFYRNDKKCYVFTTKFKEYLSKQQHKK